MERAAEIVWREAPFGLAVVNPDGKFKAVNPALCDLLGYSELELTQRTFQIITHPEDVEGDVYLAAEVRDGKRTGYSYVKRYLPKFGDVVCANLRVAGIWDGEKNFVGYVAFVARLDPRHPIAPQPEKESRKTFGWEWLTKYWIQILAGFGAVAYIVAEILKSIKR